MAAHPNSLISLVNHFRLALDMVEDPVLILEAGEGDLFIRYGNDAACTLLGISLGQLSGLPLARVMKVEGGWDHSLSGSVPFEVVKEVELADGVKGSFTATMRCVGAPAGGPASITLSLRKKAASVAIPVEPPAGEDEGEDESLTEIARGVVHDFNNYLTTVKAALTGLRLSMGEGWEHDPVVADALMATDQAAVLARRVLTFSGKQDRSRVSVDMARLLRETASLAVAGSLVQLETGEICEEALVMGEEGPLRQVLCNLLVNAKQAMPGGGRLKISLTRTCAGDTPGWQIKIRDHGCGIPEEVQDRIFEPFFTTKEGGNGIGLPLCRKVVERHKGTLSFWSRPRVGTEFTIMLPEAPAGCIAGIREQHVPEAVPMLPGSGRVLIVEDTKVLRMLAASSLKKLGYEVAEATTGTEAVETFQTLHYESGVDLVLMDLNLPGDLDGSQVGALIREIHPAVKLVACSGSLLPGEPPPEGFDASLPKPYGVGELSAIVQTVLRSRSDRMSEAA